MDVDLQTIAGAMSYKFAHDDGTQLPDGEFSGYGAVFDNEDSHGDIIKPGAFKRTLDERAAQGRLVPMHAMHGFFGGDGLPIGVWKTVAEDDRGLRVHGKISGMSTEAGKLHYERMRDGAYGGLSIAFRPYDNGVTEVDGKRHLTSVKLREISLVDDPSNALAKIDQMKRSRGLDVKTTLVLPQTKHAAAALAAALELHGACLSGDHVPTAGERTAFKAYLAEALAHLGVDDGPADATRLREAAAGFDFLRDFRI